jgi:hypothetical protein
MNFIGLTVFGHVPGQELFKVPSRTNFATTAETSSAFPAGEALVASWISDKNYNLNFDSYIILGSNTICFKSIIYRISF